MEGELLGQAGWHDHGLAMLATLGPQTNQGPVGKEGGEMAIGKAIKPSGETLSGKYFW